MAKKKKEAVKYTIDQKAIETPRAYLLKTGKVKKWVGIGGPILRKGVPPQADKVIPEATETEYLLIAKTCKLVIPATESDTDNS